MKTLSATSTAHSTSAMDVLERWMSIDGFEYEVSDRGRVRSLPRQLRNPGQPGRGSMAGRILKGRPNQRGHWRVTLCGDGFRVCVAISRLVATYFVPNPRNLAFVRHKDFDRANNAASNLEWCTHQESIERAVLGGRFTALVSPARAKVLDSEAVRVVYDMRAAGLTFGDIARVFDVGHQAVQDICHGQTWREAGRPSLSKVRRAGV
jgi:hypothetical protein